MPHTALAAGKKCRSHPLVTRHYPSHVSGHVQLNLKYSRKDILLPVLKDPAARALQVMNYFGSATKATKAGTYQINFVLTKTKHEVDGDEIP